MNLRKRFDIFCFRNRNKGIPNLMLYIVLGTGLVYLMSLMNGGEVLYEWLCFDKTKILQGQVWRLVSYVLTYSLGSNPIIVLIGLVCYYSLARAVENVWGTLRFNLYYLTMIVLMDVFAMLFCPVGAPDNIMNYAFQMFYQSSMPAYPNLTLLIAYATLFPNAQFLILFVIPVKAWILGLVYLVLTVIDIFNLCYPVFLFPHCLFPLMGFSGYILFVGKDAINLLPVSWQIRLRRLFRKKDRSGQRPPIQFTTGDYKVDNAPVKSPYTHRCSVCGRTDASHPDLEFRYCSRCQGYHCYCQDHISNHEHITGEADR